MGVSCPTRRNPCPYLGHRRHRRTCGTRLRVGLVEVDARDSETWSRPSANIAIRMPSTPRRIGWQSPAIASLHVTTASAGLVIDLQAWVGAGSGRRSARQPVERADAGLVEAVVPIGTPRRSSGPIRFECAAMVKSLRPLSGFAAAASVRHRAAGAILPSDASPERDGHVLAIDQERGRRHDVRFRPCAELRDGGSVEPVLDAAPGDIADGGHPELATRRGPRPGSSPECRKRAETPWSPCLRRPKGRRAPAASGCVHDRTQPVMAAGKTRSAGTVRSGSRAPSASGSIRRDARSSRFR